MKKRFYYESPLGRIVLENEGDYLTGVWFEKEKTSELRAEKQADILEKEENIPQVITRTKQWLELYFEGRQPDFMPEILLRGSEFQMLIWGLLREIPYGKTVTYGELAHQAAGLMGKERMSAQAVGRAVGKNPVSILVPCHRVVGAGGSLTGYAGGIWRKAALLELETR